MSECKERCKQELEELRKHHNERVQILLQQQEEKEEALKAEYKVKEEERKTENERALSLLLEENESQEALMVAKHEGEERAAKKADQLQTERNASAANQPQVPECPVSKLSEFTI